MQSTFQGKLFITLSSVSDHHLYKLITSGNDLKNGADSEKKSADEAFARYVLDYYPFMNKTYFIFVVKFVILFRECVNQYKKLENKEQDFSEVQGADIIPEICNEFITEYMDTNDNFGLDLNDAIELIQHFCNWLYENKYTVSRLTLLG